MAKMGKYGDTALKAAKVGLKTAKLPGKVVKNTVKLANKGEDITSTPRVTQAGGGGSGPFSSIYQAIKDPVANMFDFSKSTTY